MQELILDNLWEYITDPNNTVDALGITTNGCWNGTKGVMGKGNAFEAKRRYPGVDSTLGLMLKTNHQFYIEKDATCQEDEPWNIPYCLLKKPLYIFSFPTKRTTTVVNRTKSNVTFFYRDAVAQGALIPGWQGRSDLTLIERSAKLTLNIVERLALHTFILPRPGCGNGELSWNNDVKPLLTNYFDDRFYIVHYKKK